MSIITDQIGGDPLHGGELPKDFPEVTEIEKLANALFSALPGDILLNEIPRPVFSPHLHDHPRMEKALNTLHTNSPDFLSKDAGFDVANPQTSLPDPHVAVNPLSATLGPVTFTGLTEFFGNQFNPGNQGGGSLLSGIGASPSGNPAINSYAFGDPNSFAVDPATGGFPATGATAAPFAGTGVTQPSLSGSGLTPSASQNARHFQATESPDYLAYISADTVPKERSGLVPASLAGSGASPSGIHHGNEVNPANPQTSHADPHAGTGIVPSSVAGSGVSPSFRNSESGKSVRTEYPFPGKNDFVPALPVVPDYGNLNNRKNLTPDSFGSFQEGPVATPNQSDASYYFLSGRQPELYSNQLNSRNDSPFSIKPFGRGGWGENKDQLPGLASKSGIAGQFDVNQIKKDFPILQETVNGHPLVWLDNAATTQKPKQVIDRVSYFYEHENSNIHRAAHELAARATDAYEGAREKVRAFLNAGSVNEIVFVRGATEAINLVAKTWGDQNLRAGDEIIVSNLEHHANIVPWKQLADKKGLVLKVIPVDDDGQILLGEYAKLLGPKTRLVSFTQVSNALGTVTPAKQIVEMAHAAGAKVLVDGAQSVSHLRSDVRGLNCDWFVFSGHKVFGPTGIGVLYGKEDLLNETQPWQGGGNMIVDVTFEQIKYHNAPSRFEAGTGNIADAVGLGAAIDYVNKLGIDLIHQYEHYLLVYATRLMTQIPGLRLIGTAAEKASVLSFVFDGYKTEEVGAALNNVGIAVRSGHHCAQPILRRFGVETTVRPSLAFYNTCSDVDLLVETLYRLRSGYRR